MKFKRYLILTLFIFFAATQAKATKVENKSSKSITFRYVGGSGGATSGRVTLAPGESKNFSIGTLGNEHIDVPNDWGSNATWWPARKVTTNRDWGFSYADTNYHDVYFADDANWNAPRLYHADGNPVDWR
jgi:hypothetical protein